MTKETVVAVIAFGIFALAVSCWAVDIPVDGNNTTALDNSSTNATNSTFSPLNGAVAAVLNQSNQSDLWSWGDVPAGYVRKDGKIVPEANLDSDGSVMETPSQLSPNSVKDTRTGGLLVNPK